MDTSKWFIYDLRKLLACARRIVRRKSHLALNDAQRNNLADTHQELIDELERIMKMCKNSSCKGIK